MRFERELRGWELEEVAERMCRLAAFLQMPDPAIDADAVDAWEYGARMTPLSLTLLSTVLEVPAAEFMSLLDPLALPQLDALLGQGPRTIAVDEVERREFMRHALVLLGGVIALEPDRLDAALSRRVVDRATVFELRFAVRQLASAYDALPAPLLRQRAVALVETVLGLLAGPLGPRLRADLLSLGAEAATLAGWASRSDGRLRQAAGYYSMADTFAEAAEDGYLRALVALRQADLGSGIQNGIGPAGDTAPVRPLLDHAENLADPGAPAALRAIIFCRQAEECAAAGDRDEAQRYLDRADMAVVIGIGATDGIYGIPWSQTVHDSFRGNVAVLGGRPDLAAAQLERVLRELPQGTVSNRSSALADLGAAYARQGQLDYACDMLAEAWHVALSVGLQHRVRRVLGIRQCELHQWRTEPAVRRLDDRLASR